MTAPFPHPRPFSIARRKTGVLPNALWAEGGAQRPSACLTTAVARPAEMAMEVLLADLVGHRQRVPSRRRSDLIAGDIHIDVFAEPVDVLHRIRRKLHNLAGPPVPRRDDKIADLPIRVVGEKVLDMADIPVHGMNVIALELGHAVQVIAAVERRDFSLSAA